MTHRDNARSWFPEPIEKDASWAKDRESSVSWLRRSTLPRAREMRRFLNENLASLPNHVQGSFAHALGLRWESALFELIAARVFQIWGAELEIEVPNEEGRCPDILARFADQDVVVEATCPLYNQEMNAELADKNALVRLIEQLTPPGYRVGVWNVPRLSQSHSRQEFKKTIREMFDPFIHLPSEHIPVEGIEIAATFEKDEVRLMLFPERVLKEREERNEASSLFGPAVTGMDDSEFRIVKAVRTKRSQVRSSNAPAILALHGGNMGADMEDFDRALIGHSWERIEFAGYRSYVVDRGFKLDGELYRRPNNTKPPTYAGVFALLDVGVLGIKSWAFYPHPRFSGSLPDPIQNLPMRRFNVATQSIEHVSGQNPWQFIEQLRVVPSNV